MSPRRPSALRVGLIVLLGACARPAPPLRATPAGIAAPLGPPLHPEIARAQLNDTCVRCHASTAAEHEKSLHHLAFRDASFQRGYVAEPKAFCRACHAPEGDARTEPSATAQALGVACVTCHVSEGDGLVRSGAARRNDNAPHGVHRDANFGTAVCAKCHEFSFPGAEALGERGLMQKTMREHAASSRASDSCASCHMAGESGRRSHGFLVSRDEAFLRVSVSVRLSGAKPGPRTLEVAAVDVGHQMPTGDMFRRLELRFETDAEIIVRPFERSFRARPNDHGAMARFEASDTRLSADTPARVVVPVRAKHYRLVYQRATGVMQTPPFTPNVESETLLAEGDL